ncbi:MAG: OmpA family protein [Gammaproteobacteria bacterium]|nr:OmpA family protein [Gammaproteobacteria bacterium]
MKTLSNKTLFSAIVLSTALVGCGGAPKKVDSLEDAKYAYLEASNDEAVVRHAGEELDTAKSAITRAESVWKDDGSTWQVDHYAYLASQRIAIAQLIAQRKADDSELDGMDLKRQEVQLDLRSKELERKTAELEELQGKMTERGLLVTLGDVLFDVGQASLKPTAAYNIDKIADYMRKYPARTANVEGHTDSMGDEEVNLELSRERALSVRDALIQRGIASSRISTRGFGESAPVADNDSATGRQANRRVEIIFPEAVEVVSALAQ